MKLVKYQDQQQKEIFEAMVWTPWCLRAKKEDEPPPTITDPKTGARKIEDLSQRKERQEDQEEFLFSPYNSSA